MAGDDLGEIWFNTDTECIDNQDRESQVSYTPSYTISDAHTYVAVKYNSVRYYRPFEISSEWARGPAMIANAKAKSEVSTCHVASYELLE
jgi:hypothetical protein